LNNDAFQEISSVIKNSDLDKVKLSKIDSILKKTKEGQEKSIDGKREWILKKLIENPDGNLAEEVISEIKNVINYKLQTSDARRLSENVGDHIEAIQHKSLEGFTHVTRMYRATFWSGVIILFFGVFLTAYLAISKTPYAEISPYLAIIFGGGGISSMFTSLYLTARKLQQSRANASQLAIALNEWQFLSLWSGKTYQTLLEKYEKDSSNNILTVEVLKEFLDWKKELTKNMIIHIQEYVAISTDKAEPGDKANPSNVSTVKKQAV